MDLLKNIIAYVQTNQAQVLAAFLLCLRFIESVIVMTKTKKDDKIFAKIKEMLKQFFKLGWE